jgi:DNA-binding NtrC family response regulator
LGLPMLDPPIPGSLPTVPADRPSGDGAPAMPNQERTGPGVDSVPPFEPIVTPAQRPAETPSAESAPTDSSEVLPLDEIEKRHILAALRHTNANRTRAAALLGISIRTLRNKLQEYRAAGTVIEGDESAAD